MKETIALYRVDEVESYLVNHPDGFDFKAGYELLAGCVLAKCAMRDNAQSVGVGFRLIIKGPLFSNERPCLKDLIEKFTIDDRDIDIFIGNDDWRSAYQVTRVLERGQGSTSYQRLISVLNKKLLIQPDPMLQLVMLIDETFNLKYDKLHKYLINHNKSYGKVYLIGQTGNYPILGKFQCIELYPDLCTYDEVEICLIKEK